MSKLISNLVILDTAANGPVALHPAVGVGAARRRVARVGSWGGARGARWHRQTPYIIYM